MEESQKPKDENPPKFDIMKYAADNITNNKDIDRYRELQAEREAKAYAEGRIENHTHIHEGDKYEVNAGGDMIGNAIGDYASVRDLNNKDNNKTKQK